MSRDSTILLGLLLVGAAAEAQASPPLEVLTDKASGRMYAIRVTPTPAEANAPTPNPTPSQFKATADQFLSDNRTLIGIRDPARDLVATPATTDNLGLSRVQYFQKHMGCAWLPERRLRPITGGSR